MLAAAEQVFAERGLEAKQEDVAAVAGVGVGTVYRRFPSKAVLFEAVFERGIAAGVELLAECSRLPSAGEGVREYLRRTVLEQSGNRGLHEFLYIADGDHFDHLRQRIEPPLTALIERAKAEGSLRADFRATDVPPITLMLSRLAHTDRVLGPQLARRYLEFLLNGIAPAEDQVPVEPAVDDDTLGAWFAALRRTS